MGQAEDQGGQQCVACSELVQLASYAACAGVVPSSADRQFAGQTDAAADVAASAAGPSSAPSPPPPTTQTPLAACFEGSRPSRLYHLRHA